MCGLLVLLPQDPTSQWRKHLWILDVQIPRNVPPMLAVSCHFPSGGLIWSSIPLLFVATSKECPVLLREFLRVVLDLFRIWKTFFWIFSSRPINIIEHRHEDDSIFKTCRFNVFFLQVLLDVFSWRKSWENIPLELNRFSINVHIKVLSENPFVEILPLDLTIFDLNLQDPSFSTSIRQNLNNIVLLPLTTWSSHHEPAKIVHERDAQ